MYGTISPKNKVENARNALQEAIEKNSSINIKTVLNEFSQSIQVMFADMIKEAQQELLDQNQLTPPCAFSIMASGSFGRDLLSPYSDMDFFIIVDDEKARRKGAEEHSYFIALITKVNEKVKELGESEKTAPGLRLDTGDIANIIEHNELINTPQGYLDNSLNAKAINTLYVERYSLLFSKEIYGGNGSKLTSDYHENKRIASS